MTIFWGQTILAAIFFVIAFYAWRQNEYMIWFFGRMQSWMEDAHKILEDSPDNRDDAYRMWNEHKPSIDMFFIESSTARIPMLVCLASTLILLICAPFGFAGTWITAMACFGVVGAAWTSVILYFRKHHTIGLYKGYQIVLDSMEATLAEDDEKTI